MKSINTWMWLIGLSGAASLAGCQFAKSNSEYLGKFRAPRSASAAHGIDQLAGVDQQSGTRTSENSITLQKPSTVLKHAVPQAGGEQQLHVTAEPAGGEMQDIPETGHKAAQIRLVAAVSGVQTPVQQPSMDLDELLRLAVDANPTLRQAYAIVQQAEGNWLQVGLYPNPNFEWHSEANNAPFDGHYGVLSQEIVTSKKLKLNRQVASSDIQGARWEAEAQNLRVLNDVRLRYTAVLGAQRRVFVADELLKIADDGVRVSEKLFRGEQVSQADVLQATLQQRQTQILARNSKVQLEAAWRQLANVIGHPYLPAHLLIGDLEEDIQEIDWDTAWQGLDSHSPQLHAARSRAVAAYAQVQRERAEPVPNLQVAAGTGVDVLPAGEGFQMYNVSLGSTLPIWNRNQGNIAAASWMLQAAQAEVSRLELALRDRLADAFARYQSAKNEVDLYRDPILPTAEKNLQLAQLAYDEGEFDFLRVLIARHDLFQARINYVNSLTELQEAAIEIHGLLLTGGLESVETNPVPANSAGQTADQGR